MMLGSSRLIIGAADVAVVLALIWGYGHGRFNAGYAAGAAKIHVAWDKEKIARAAAASAHSAKATGITTKTGEQAEAAQVVFRTRYRNLIQKVTEYVPPDADPIVPVGLVGLLDQAAAGDDPDAVSVAAGRTHERAQPTRLSTLGTVVVGNYGVCNAEIDRFSRLQGWVREQQVIDEP
jgi:hypothetical protein